MNKAKLPNTIYLKKLTTMYFITFIFYLFTKDKKKGQYKPTPS